jgi:hypothetical protein
MKRYDRRMSSIKVVRDNGRVKHYLDVIDFEYERGSDCIEMEIKIVASNDFNDFIVEECTLNKRDRAFLMNDQGVTIDIIKA